MDKEQFHKEMQVLHNEFKEKTQVLYNEFEEKRIKLYRKYIDSNAKYKIGDIITNGKIIIKISDTNSEIWDGIPKPYYWGQLYTKKIAPYKNGNYGAITFNSDIRLIEREKCLKKLQHKLKS